MKRRNEICEARDCKCGCHQHTRFLSHCHEGRRCRDVECNCARRRPVALTPITLPEIRVRRGGITYGGRNG